MVGGFSFYERAEIRDLLSYLKLVQNPHDSVALQRSINTPPRGIGKTTLETLERLALETGMSTWEAIEHAIRSQLVPARAAAALQTFQQLIRDAQALLDPDFGGKLSADLHGESDPADLSSPALDEISLDQISYDMPDAGFSFGENIRFDFGDAATDDSATLGDAGEATEFDFGGSDFGTAADAAPAPLFDASSLSPFSKSTARVESRNADRNSPSSPTPGAPNPLNPAQDAFRTPGGRGTLLNSFVSSSIAAVTSEFLRRKDLPKPSAGSKT